MFADDAVDRKDDLEISYGSETIAASRFRPAEEGGPLPALLVLTPYRKDDADIYATQYDATISYLAASGYEVVVADLVGTGSSSGFKAETYSADEGAQGAHLVEWLADRSWTTGRIGMFGKSYRGKTTLHTAAECPDSLEAIVPIMGPNSSYDHSRFPGGAQSFRHLGSWLPWMHAFSALPPNRRDADGRWVGVWNDRLAELAESTPWGFQQLDHPTKDEYWLEKEFDLEGISTPTFIVAGFRDFLQHDPFEQAERIGGLTRVLVGPWRHVTPHRGREAAIAFREQMVEWFDYFLKDEPTGALEGPPIVYWSERNGGGMIDGGAWRGAESWPTLSSDGSIDDARSTNDVLSYALTPDGLTPTRQFEGGDGKYEVGYEFDHTVGMDSLFYLGQPTETSADDARSLTAETTPLSRPVEFTGTGAVTVRLSSTTPNPLLAVRVVDVSPNGAGRLVTYGVVQTALRNDRSNPEPLQPGEEYAIAVPLRPRSHVFESDHRIRIAFSASYFPWLLPNREHGSFTIRSTPDDPSSLRFPGRSRDEASFDDELELDPPSEVPYPTAGRYVRSDDRTIERIRETDEDVARLRTIEESTVDLPAGVYRSEETVEYTVAASDPTTTVARTERRIELERPTERVEAVTTNRVTHDTSQLAVTVNVDGETAYERRWRYAPDRT